MAKKETNSEIIITEMKESSVELFIVGKTPLIINRLSEKAKRELLMPKGRMTQADKAVTLKHNPLAEFRSSAYVISDSKAPTYLAIPAASPKRAIAAAALDMPGAAKAQIGRLTWVPSSLGLLPVYGQPQLLMSVVRMANLEKTPDIRTRCILPEWAVRLSINFVTPILTPQVVLSLLAAAGLYVGIGDWRSQKGAGNYGQFYSLVTSKASEIKHILKMGRKAQIEAMENPITYDDESAELLQWFADESKQRGKEVAA